MKQQAEMTDSSIFISSCTRRQLARRRPVGWLGRGRYLLGRPRSGRAGRAHARGRALPVLLTVVVLSAALGAVIAGRGAI